MVVDKENTTAIAAYFGRFLSMPMHDTVGADIILKTNYLSFHTPNNVTNKIIK